MRCVQRDGTFKGIIFFGLMLTEEGPRKCLSTMLASAIRRHRLCIPQHEERYYRCRLKPASTERSIRIDLEFEDNAAVCVVLASDGYPVSYEKGYPIEGLETFKGKDGYYVFHAGTANGADGSIVTNGGRVLGVTAKGDDLKQARAMRTRR